MLRSVAVLVALAANTPALAQQAGQLISAEPVVQTPGGSQAWKIRYWTTTTESRPIQVTGMVVAPREAIPPRPRDVIAWTHGTWGVVEKCAPSLSPRFFELTPAVPAVASGKVVVAPDYPGLGAATPHPYLVGRATARSTLDAVRAAQQIAGAAAGPRFAVWGESQGGHAALWTGQRARAYAPELVLVGIAAGAPVTDLAANFRAARNPNAKAFMTALATYSWSQHYGIPLVIGRRGTPGIIRRMAQNCVDSLISPNLGTMLGMLTLRRDLKGVDLASTQPWARYVRANSLAPQSPVPVQIAQTREDPLVSSAVTRQYAGQLCRAGVRVDWVDLPGKDHATTAKQSASATLAWINDRFAGARAPSDCGRI
ncbi:lipase family protein [Sphingomonas arenae]|uniref:lipase family protein n=1 Tax=Sphingomonas arenae TaxID=2812555 RepID=UPI001967C190|nr:lipase family protein [Sphingomonas arenae]